MAQLRRRAIAAECTIPHQNVRRGAPARQIPVGVRKLSVRNDAAARLVKRAIWERVPPQVDTILEAAKYGRTRVKHSPVRLVGRV